MKISVFGTGYVGLVAGTCFAESGNDVYCIDIDQQKVDALNNGQIPIYEPGLEELVKRNTKESRLKFSSDVKLGVEHGDVIFIAVGTPPDGDGKADLKFVLSVADTIGTYLNGYKVIVDKSTVPVGTAAKVKQAIAAKTDGDFDVVSNPEFLKEGAAIDDFMKPDRVVIGAESEKAAEIMRELYSPFMRTSSRLFVMDVASAEMTKYAANCMLAARISFMNEIANICDAVGANVDNVRAGIGSDSRIGTSFLFSGIGYGGSCFPKDVRALSETAKENGVNVQLLDSIHEVNDRQKSILCPRISKYFNGDLKGKTIAIWGLAFKPNTDDVREAPAIELINFLLNEGVTVQVHDPEAMQEMEHIFPVDKIKYCGINYAALDGADALIIATEWNEYRRPDFNRMKELLKAPVIFDGRNLYDLQKMQEMGWDYFSIGRNL